MLTNICKITPITSVRCYATSAAVKPRVKQKPAAAPRPYIECKRAEFNLQVPAAAASKFGSIPLASGGWLHHKSKNDYFIINPTVSAADISAEMQFIGEFLDNNNGLAFDAQLLHNLKQERGIDKFTSIQSKAIPKIYDSHHTLIAAETGCGKTLAYLLPIVQRVLQQKSNTNSTAHKREFNTPIALILTPGRELATQISQVARELCQGTDLQVKCVLGGHTKKLMMNPEFEDVDILVATIGALSKLVTTGIYRMGQVRHLVLDEADTMLDDSFADKMTHFLKRFPFHKNHMQTPQIVGTQLVLASATMPVNISDMLHKFIDVETIHNVVSPHLHRLMPHVQQHFMRMVKADRPTNMLSIVKQQLEKKRPLIIFSNKSASCDYVAIFLNKFGVNCLNLNGDMLMKIRLGRFEQFQNGECNVLSTTDVASRGLDTTRARHVINFDFPMHISDYIHRCGRIGRVGSDEHCKVSNLISSRREISLVQRIEHAARTATALPDVNANIKSIINAKILKDMQAAGVPVQQEDAF